MIVMLKFTKMHGLGNDFVVIDAINQQVNLNTQQIQFLADRQFGIGCDQLLLVEKASSADIDFRYRIFNADGSEVEQCGNGVRCFARFVYDKAMTAKDTIAVETAAGIIYPSLLANGDVKVDMGLPRFEPSQVPFNAEILATSYPLLLTNQETLEISVLSMGNPHAVTMVNDIDNADVATLGPMVENHQLFPEKVNAGFMQILNPEAISLRVYERGAGETLACGTGACAAVVSGIQRGLLNREVNVKLPGGELLIAWPDDQSSVWMTGPATHVFDGEISWATIHNQ
jgi:diaminopimelate epimerase